MRAVLFTITNEYLNGRRCQKITQDSSPADYDIKFRQLRPGIAKLTIPRGESENKYAKLRLQAFYHNGIKLLNYVLHSPPDENDGKFCYTVTIQDELNNAVDMNDTGFELLASFIEHKCPE